MNRIICYTDGGSRGNPGLSGVGVVIEDGDGNVLKEYSEAIGNATNNYAEYHAVATALRLLVKKFGKKTKTMDVEVRMDSELVKKQLSGEYQIKEPGLVPHFIEIHNMHVASFPKLTFKHIPREKNKHADRLANEAMDNA